MRLAFAAMRCPPVQDQAARAFGNRPIPFAKAEEGAGFQVCQIVSHAQVAGIWAAARVVIARRAMPRAGVWPTATSITVRAQTAIAAS